MLNKKTLVLGLGLLGGAVSLSATTVTVQNEQINQGYTVLLYTTNVAGSGLEGGFLVAAGSVGARRSAQQEFPVETFEKGGGCIQKIYVIPWAEGSDQLTQAKKSGFVTYRPSGSGCGDWLVRITGWNSVEWCDVDGSNCTHDVKSQQKVK